MEQKNEVQKKKDKVALFKLNPPQTQYTILPPKTGMAEIKFVITVAPHKDICPQGRT